MKIVLPEVLPSTATPKVGDVQSAQWRKALEQAQWQARQRVARDPGSADPATGTTGDAVRARENSARPGAAADPAARSSDAAATTTSSSRLQQVADAVGRAVQVAAARSATGIGGAMPAPVTGEPTSAAATLATSPGEAPSATLMAWQELPEWPAVVVYASVTGNRISVGMRDRSVAAHEVRALFERLRAQLRGSGLELTHLVINGQQMSADDIVPGIA